MVKIVKSHLVSLSNKAYSRFCSTKQLGVLVVHVLLCGMLTTCSQVAS